MFNFFLVWGQCIVLFVKIMVIFNCNQLFVCLFFLWFSGAFDLLAYTNRDQEIPETWEESQARIIANSQEVRLRSFSTSVHKVDTMVSYKGEDWCKQDDIACPAHNSCTKVHVWKWIHTHSTRILFLFYQTTSSSRGSAQHDQYNLVKKKKSDKQERIYQGNCSYKFQRLLPHKEKWLNVNDEIHIK